MHLRAKTEGKIKTSEFTKCGLFLSKENSTDEKEKVTCKLCLERANWRIRR